MALIFKWLLRILSGLLVLGGLAVALVYFFASRSLPEYNKDLQTGFVSAPVEIVRNNANVPHIFGERDEDDGSQLGDFERSTAVLALEHLADHESAGEAHGPLAAGAAGVGGSGRCRGLQKVFPPSLSEFLPRPGNSPDPHQL